MRRLTALLLALALVAVCACGVEDNPFAADTASFYASDDGTIIIGGDEECLKCHKPHGADVGEDEEEPEPPAK